MIILPEIQDKLKLHGFTHAEQVEIVDRLEMYIAKKINSAFMDRLGDPDRKLFVKLTKKGNTAAIEAFLNTKIPNFRDIVRQVAQMAIEDFNSLREKE